MTKKSKISSGQLRLTGPTIVIQRPKEKKITPKIEEPLGSSELSQRLATAVAQELKENGSDGRLTLTRAWRKVRKESE